MPYYHTCPLCGAHLDPCEHCDCQDEEEPSGEKEQPRAAQDKRIEIILPCIPKRSKRNSYELRKEYIR